MSRKTPESAPERKSATSERPEQTDRRPAPTDSARGSAAGNRSGKQRVTVQRGRPPEKGKERSTKGTGTFAKVAVTSKAVGTSSTESAIKQTESRSTDLAPTTTASKTDTIAKPADGPGKSDVSVPAATAASAQTSGADDTTRLHKGLEWEYCGQRPAKLGPVVLPPLPGDEDPLYVGADTFDYDRELELLSLGGNVEVVQGSRYVGADKIIYDRGTADLLATGNAILSNPGVRLAADKAEMNLESDTGSLSDVQYRLSGKINARGSADRAELVQPEVTRFENIVYTTCRPGQNDWTLAAEELELDQSTGRGIARKAKLRVRSVPVLYTPYLSFPIDDRRKSGVLVPSIGNSDGNGFDIRVPYYWNIAPNMDATFFPRYMSERGAMLGTEFRYLSDRQNAELYGEIIPRDNKLEGNRTRWAVRVEHKARIAPAWSSDINFNEVSDDEYLEDFGNSLELTSTRNIERRGDLFYHGDRWRLRTRLLDYQTVDASIAPADRPYARLPQMLLDVTPLRIDSGIRLGLSGEYNFFQHSAEVHGHRASLNSYATWPLRKSYGHLIPRVDLHLAGYSLKDVAPEQSTNPSYAIPSFNLDGKLIFERTVQWFAQESLQTLEPRLFYLYTPFVDQDDIPVFDSSEFNYISYSLFRANRFTGRDRIGDANQLTLGLSSRTLALDSGRELLHASVGQILYFRDRDVQIVGPPETNSSSSIAGELSARILEDWTGQATIQWDPNQDTDQSPKRALALHYQTDDDRLFNLAYRFDQGTSEATKYEDTDLNFRMPVNPQLQLVGRWYYSLLNSQTVEAFAGVEYGRCCWRVRLLGQHLKNRAGSTGSNTFMVQIELAGLGSIGQQVDNFLERGIYGYHAD